METVILCGIQASGKTTFYVRRFLSSHVRISLDVLRTRARERKLLELCLGTNQRFVVDNTNPTAADRARYITPAREAGFRVVGYLFDVSLDEAFARNAHREGKERIPEAAIVAAHRKLETPSREEGFDELYLVRADDNAGFQVERM
jgi:predicted kinase